MISKAKTIGKLFKSCRSAFSSVKNFEIQKQENLTDVVKRDHLQFSKSKLNDFGELNRGEVPDALKFDRPIQATKLGNGIRVGTEIWNSQLASVTVMVKAGSRNETLETSGVSQFIARLVLRGTASKNRSQLEKELETLGANVCYHVGRETTSWTLTARKENIQKGAALLGEMLTQSLFNQNQIEAEREEIYRNCVENVKDQMNATLEATHYTPVLGIRENIHNITQGHIKEFMAANYCGGNVSVSGAGNLSHQELVGIVEKSFSKLPEKGQGEPKNLEKPYFTPSTMFMRDDEMANINTGVFLKAPTWNDPEFFALQLVQAIMGEYRADKYTGAHLNHPSRQYSIMHAELGRFPDITLQKCVYLPYSDCAVFGNYFHGNEIFGNQMLLMGQLILTEFGSYLEQSELIRARNTIYNKLLQQDNSCKVSMDISKQLIYLGRRVPRSEVAARIAAMDTHFLQRMISRLFFDSEVAAVAWGPIGHMMSMSHYNRPIKRSTLGWYGSNQYHVL